jgi:hypothetical protein
MITIYQITQCRLPEDSLHIRYREPFRSHKVICVLLSEWNRNQRAKSKRGNIFVIAVNNIACSEDINFAVLSCWNGLMIIMSPNTCTPINVAMLKLLGTTECVLFLLSCFHCIKSIRDRDRALKLTKEAMNVFLYFSRDICTLGPGHCF